MNNVKIFNGTPHPINVVTNVTYKEDIRKYVSDNPQIVKSIPSNGVLSARIETVEGNTIEGIPTFKKKIVGCDPIPEGYDIIIVSALYVSAARAMGWDTSRLYTVADPVYSLDGKTILGCRGICPAF